MLEFKSNLFWSLHIRHTYLLGALKILKKIAMCSLRSFEGKANKPNGPIMSLLATNS